MYRSVATEAGGKPVVFRTLDVGGDKVLPYLRQAAEENPALGWRAIRLSLDRPGLLRTQVRALLRATAGAELRLLLPMVTATGEIGMARALIDRELDLFRRRGCAASDPGPTRGDDRGARPARSSSMPCCRSRRLCLGRQQRSIAVLVRRRPQQCPGGRQIRSSLRGAAAALRAIAQTAERHAMPLSLCGEMAGRPSKR